MHEYAVFMSACVFSAVGIVCMVTTVVVVPVALVTVMVMMMLMVMMSVWFHP